MHSDNQKHQYISIIPGAKSFADLRYVGGCQYDTFHEAAIAMNLLETDNEWDRSMAEAIVFGMPSQLRELFATILIHGNPANPLELYNKYKTDLYEDYTLEHSLYMAEQLTLRDIGNHLMQSGKYCKDFKLPSPVDTYPEEINEQLSDLASIADRMYSMMNTEQCTAFDIIMNAVNMPNCHQCFFLSGACGCGKTFLYEALINRVTSEGGFVKAVAPTGLAATLLPGGKTVHSAFGISVHLNEKSVF